MTQREWAVEDEAVRRIVRASVAEGWSDEALAAALGVRPANLAEWAHLVRQAGG